MPDGAGSSSRATPARRRDGMRAIYRSVDAPAAEHGCGHCGAQLAGAPLPHAGGPDAPRSGTLQSVDLYFAYGSNMSSRRLLERVASARPRGPARLRGMRLAVNKRGRDGSGKANVVIDARTEVWGVVYEISPDEWQVLDRFEWGYVRRRDEVWMEETRVGVQLYTARAPFVDEGLRTFDWYREYLLEGAREHALPERVIVDLLSLPVLPGRAGPAARGSGR